MRRQPTTVLCRRARSLSIPLQSRWSTTTTATTTAPTTTAATARATTTETPLLRELHARIKVRGPMSVYEYMSLCLSHPVYGYYTRNKVFGAEGDFTTSPEISQTFGEMIGVWCVASWKALGEPAAFRIVEIGGGQGTLMKDVVRATSSFPKFIQALKRVSMVDTSPRMRAMQQKTLLGMELDQEEGGSHKQGRSSGPRRGFTNSGRTQVEWCERLEEISGSEPVILIAQELFDALPIHQFELTKDKGWCERLVDVDVEEDSSSSSQVGGKKGLRFTLSPGPNPAAKALLGPFMLNPALQPGMLVEVGSAAEALAQTIGMLISKHQGSALIVDYGVNDTIRHASLRGIKRHAFVDPLLEPGNVDLSVDVDFSALRRSMRKGLAQRNVSPIPNVMGPISQAEFLTNLGIQYRVAALLRNIASEDEKLDVFAGYKRLVEDMGQVYKCMVISSVAHAFPGFSSLDSTSSSSSSSSAAS